MGQEQWFCLFRGDAGPMAVPAESVAEVLDVDRLVRLAWSPPQVAGLCPYHREVVPVVRLAPSPHRGRTNPASRPDPAAGAEPSGEAQDVEDRARRVILILRTGQGAWGIRSDAAWTIMSRECPEHHPPHTDGDGPVLVGTILHAGVSYGVLDTEATWHGLRSAIGRWHGLSSEPEITPPIAPGADGREPPQACHERSGQSHHCRGGE
jgi:chemotaxis signal transduction protein